MADRESIITHLQIIKTWAAFARERDLQFFTAKHLENIAQWADDALNLLKEQGEKKWINVNDRLPDEKGSYLVAYKAFQYTLIGVKRFAKNLHSVDKYYFPKEHRPGWYEYDDDYGYFERTDVTHWMQLPDAPE